MRTIGEVADELTGIAGRFDADACTVEHAREVSFAAERIERAAGAIKAQAAAQIAAANTWEAAGDRSPAHQLARETGSTVGAARSLLETGRVMRERPELAAAASRGELSVTQAAALAPVGHAAPELLVDLMSRAGQTTVAELRPCARALATCEPDPGARERRIHEQRSLRRWVEASGAHVAQLRGTAEMIARGVHRHRSGA